jgi:hypothetical protein
MTQHTAAPVRMSASAIRSRPSMKQLVVSVILTDDQIAVAIVSFVAVDVMNLHLRRQRPT